jgi:hypothetical protein
LAVHTPEQWGTIAPAIADELRRALPDVSDAVIGRVVLAVSESMRPGTGDEDELSAANVWAVLASTGLRLAESEWVEL